jgi:hypothetical protein
MNSAKVRSEIRDLLEENRNDILLRIALSSDILRTRANIHAAHRTTRRNVQRAL